MTDKGRERTPKEWCDTFDRINRRLQTILKDGAPGVIIINELILMLDAALHGMELGRAGAIRTILEFLPKWVAWAEAHVQPVVPVELKRFSTGSAYLEHFRYALTLVIGREAELMDQATTQYGHAEVACDVCGTNCRCRTMTITRAGLVARLSSCPPCWRKWGEVLNEMQGEEP